MGLWRAYGMADAARCCSGPLRSPNQCLLLAKASCLTLPPLLLAGSKVPNSSGSADQVATRWAGILLGFPCFGCVLTGDAGGCDVPLEWLMPHGFAQGRYVRPTNACRLPNFLLHPSTFAFSGCDGAKRQRLVATRWAWILLRFPCFGCVLTGDAGGCDVPLEWLMPHGAAQGRYVRPTNACCLPKLPASPVHLCF